MSSATSLVVASGDHTRLAVDEWPSSPPSGPPIVALHPGVGDRRIWRWCAPAWASAGHRVVAYDRRGFGRTIYRAEAHDDLDDLLAVTDATGCRPAIVVGNSRGGGLALDLALAHPDQVSALVLIAPSPSGYPEDHWPTSPAEARLDELIAAAEEHGTPDDVNRLEVHYWLDGVDQPEGRVQGPARDLLLDMNGGALRADPTGDSLSRRPSWPDLGHITVPTLVVAGEYDLPGINQLCAELAAALPDGRLVTVPGAAHCPMLDQPERLNEIVLAFLAGGTGAAERRLRPPTPGAR